MDWIPSVIWHRDRGGYRIEERHAVEGKTIAHGRAGGWYLIGNSGEVEGFSLRGLNETPLFLAFANLGREGGSMMSRAAEFAADYGLPVSGNEIDEDQLGEFVRMMRASVVRIIEGKPETIGFKLGSGTKASLVPGTLDLELGAGSLMAFMWLEALRAAKSDVPIKACPACGSYFIAKSRKRAWCSDACRQKAFRDAAREQGL